MAQDKFSAHSFNPELLRQLYAAFQAAWRPIQPHTDAGTREHVRDAIAVAVVEMAKSGEGDLHQIGAYARMQAHIALQALTRRQA